MRYLVEWKENPIPPEWAKTGLALVEATEAWVEAEMKAGRVIEVWEKTEGGGGIAIMEAESNDAVFKKLQEVPLQPFFSYCVTPLTDYKVACEVYKTQLKQMIK